MSRFDSQQLPGSTSPPARDALADIRSLVAMFRRRQRVFFIALGAMLALLLLLAFAWPRSYTSEARIIAGMGHQQSGSPADATTNLPILNALMLVSGIQSGETYAELLTETPVAQRVIDDLQLRTTAPALLSDVKVEPVNNTSIIAIAATWSTPEMSARIANAFASTFIERERDLVAGQADAAIDFLSSEMPAAAARQRVTEAALGDFERRNQIADITSQTQATVAALSAGDVKTAQLQLDRRQATAQLRSATSQAASLDPVSTGSQSAAPNPVLQQLETQLALVNTQLGTARSTYTEKHPLVAGLEAQQRQLQQQIARESATVISSTSFVPNPVYQQLGQLSAGFRAQIAADDAGLAELALQRRGLLAQVRSLPAQTLAFATLERDSKQAEAVYTALQQRMSDAMIAKSTAISDVTITQLASPADAAAHPSRSMIVALGLALALILASTLTGLLEYLDRRARGEDEIRAIFGRKVLGSIPDTTSQNVEIRPWLRALVLESLLQIVRALQYSSPRHLRSIAFTSPGPGDGKTTVAINVARTIAELDAPVLLIDADLRRPAVHRVLNVKNETGLSDVLAGDATLAASIRTTSIPGLHLLTSGTPATAPVRLLQSGQFERLLIDAARQNYRTVIVDLPAMLPIVDAAIVAEKVDGTVLVVSVDTAGAASARDTVAFIEQVGVRNLLGIIVNRARRDIGRDYCYYASTSGAPLALP